MNTIRFNEQNVSVFMTYTDLQKMMKECVQTTLKEMKDEQKKVHQTHRRIVWGSRMYHQPLETRRVSYRKNNWW